MPPTLNNVLITLLILALATVYSTKLKSSWDNILYTGAVLKMDGHDQNDAHSKVYETLKEANTEKQFYYLSGEYGSEYRTTVYKDPKSLSELMPGFEVKYLFVCASYLVYKMGAPLHKSTSLVSIIFFVLCLLLFHFSISSSWRFGALPLILLVLAMATAPATSNLARLSSPDMMSVFFLFLAAVLFLKKYNTLWVYLALGLSILVRPENVIFAAVFALINLFSNRDAATFRSTGVGLGMVGLSYAVTQLVSAKVKWSVLFYHTFISKLNYPISDPQHIDLMGYLKTLLQRVDSFVFPALVFILLTMLLFRLSNSKEIRGKSQVLVASIGLSSLFRFLLFPLWEIRFFFAYLLIMITMMVLAVGQEKASTTL